jgi:molybdenum cofactor cytidylyltransferase
MNLFESLEIKTPLKAAVVGAGGKTTAVFQLAYQAPGKTWVTTTTHLGTDQLTLADRHFILAPEDEFRVGQWLQQKVTLLTGPQTADERMRGVDAGLLDSIEHIASKEHVSVIVEADGARSHPIKAPAEHEPVIPSWVETVIVVVGLRALGKPLGSEWVHRPEIYSRLTRLQMGEPIHLQSVITMLNDPQGGLKNIPAHAQRIALFNQLDAHPLDGNELQQMQLLSSQYDLVLAGSLAFDPDHIQRIAVRETKPITRS